MVFIFFWISAPVVTCSSSTHHSYYSSLLACSLLLEQMSIKGKGIRFIVLYPLKCLHDLPPLARNHFNPLRDIPEHLAAYSAEALSTSLLMLGTVQTFNSCTSRPDVRYYLAVQTPTDKMSKNKPSTSMTHVSCESKLRLVARSSMHPYPGNLVATGRSIVYYARTVHTFSTGIKCRHCTHFAAG